MIFRILEDQHAYRVARPEQVFGLAFLRQCRAAGKGEQDEEGMDQDPHCKPRMPLSKFAAAG